MLTTIRNHIQNHRAKRAARRRYDEHADMYGYLLSKGRNYSDPKTRISNLELLEFTAGAMSRECKIFDNDRFCEDGFSPAQWHMNEAALFLLVYAAESGDWSEVEVVPEARSLWINPAVDEVLHQIAQTEDMGGKGGLLLDLCDTVTAYVGSQAAEALAALAHVYFVESGVAGREAHKMVWPR